MGFNCKCCGKEYPYEKGYYAMPCGPICCECYDKIVQTKNRGNYNAIKDIEKYLDNLKKITIFAKPKRN